MKFTSLSLVAVLLAVTAQAYPANGGGFDGPGISTSTVAEALKMQDDTAVILNGKIEKSLGNEKYLFNDGTGTIVVEIDDDDWRGVTVKPENTVEIKGEVDKELMAEPEIDVDTVTLKQ